MLDYDILGNIGEIIVFTTNIRMEGRKEKKRKKRKRERKKSNTSNAIEKKIPVSLVVTRLISKGYHTAA